MYYRQKPWSEILQNYIIQNYYSGKEINVINKKARREYMWKKLIHAEMDKNQHRLAFFDLERATASKIYLAWKHSCRLNVVIDVLQATASSFSYYISP